MEMIYLLAQVLKGSRKTLYDINRKRAQKNGRLPAEAMQVFNEIEAACCSQIKETELQRKIRVEQNFSELVMGRVKGGRDSSTPHTTAATVPFGIRRERLKPAMPGAGLSTSTSHGFLAQPRNENRHALRWMTGPSPATALRQQWQPLERCAGLKFPQRHYRQAADEERRVLSLAPYKRKPLSMDVTRAGACIAGQQNTPCSGRNQQALVRAMA
jgi:hypothetical protein